MSAEAPRETSLGIEEVVFLVDVKQMVVIPVTFLVVFVVVAVGLVTHVAVLDIAEYGPLVVDVIGSLQEHVTVEFVGIRVVILKIHVIDFVSCVVFLQPYQIFAHDFVANIVKIAEMVTVEVLESKTADDVPRVILVVGIPHQTIGVLGESLLANEIRTLDEVAFIIVDGQSELRQFVIGTELLVIAIAVGIVQ